MVNLYRAGMDPSNKFVCALVASEACYLNTAHPDFVNGHRAMAIINEKLGLTQREQSGQGGGTRSTSSGNISSKAGPGGGPGSALTANLPNFNNDGIFSSVFSKKPDRKPGVLEKPPPVLKASGSISEREFIEIEVISECRVLWVCHRVLTDIRAAADLLL